LNQGVLRFGNVSYYGEEIANEMLPVCKLVRLSGSGVQVRITDYPQGGRSGRWSQATFSDATSSTALR
jgi:hypothetical protein